jgi:predicted XRE-type DNA-binding protein|tara:strand:+ start:698 stop:922 length:225 start_codon:yes stop_codon:yes gene_type:complete
LSVAKPKKVSTAKLKKQILVHIHDTPMSLIEVAQVMEVEEKRVFKLLRSLFKKEKIKMVRDDEGIRKYIKNDIV